MALTFGDLRTAAQGTDFTAVSITVVDRALNDAIQDILRKASVPAREVSTTITTVAGTATYSLPAATERILSVLGADGTELDQIDRQDVDPIAVGDPSAFALYGTDVIFSPVPAAAATYTVLYTGLPTADLVSANVVSTMTGIPDNYAQAAVSFARSRLFALEDDAEMSAFWRAEYERDLRALRGDLGMRRVGRHKRVPGMLR